MQVTARAPSPMAKATRLVVLRAPLLRLKSALTDGKQITEGWEDEKSLSPLERRYEAKGKDGAATIHPSRLFRVS